MGRTTDVDASRIGMGDRQCFSGFARFKTDFALALYHDYLHHLVWNVAPHRVRRLAHSLKRDIGSAVPTTLGQFTNVDDVTHDHANPRAICTIAIPVFRSAIFHFATFGERRVSSARFAAQGRLLR